MKCCLFSSRILISCRSADASFSAVCMQSPRMRKFAAILVYKRTSAGRSHRVISRMPPSCCGYQRLSSGFSAFTEAILLLTIIRLSASTPCSYSLCRYQADLLPLWFNYNGNPPRARYHLRKSGAFLNSTTFSGQVFRHLV
jgi:hypothetical protein